MKYKQTSCVTYSETGTVVSTHEKTIDNLVLKLEYHKRKNANTVDLKIEKDREEIAFIRSIYFSDEKLLLIEDIDTHRDYRRKGLGKLRVKEVISFLRSKGETPQTIIAQEVGYLKYLGIPDGEQFIKTLGFQPIENSNDWKVSIG
jgi:GNAT superfamily N-acetyltransferase